MIFVAAIYTIGDCYRSAVNILSWYVSVERVFVQSRVLNNIFVEKTRDGQHTVRKFILLQCVGLYICEG